MKKVFLVMLVLLFAGCGSSGGGHKAAVEVPYEGVEVKTLISENGVAAFEDRDGERVNIILEDESGVPLSGIKVEFWDGKKVKVVAVLDPAGVYAPDFEVYGPKFEGYASGLEGYASGLEGSGYTITMSLMGEDPYIDEVPFDSNKGRAIDNLKSDSGIEFVHHGTFTPEEIDQADEMHLMIINMSGLGKFFKFVSQLNDFIGLFDKVEEPEFYEVYTLIPKGSWITSTIYYLEPVDDVDDDIKEACGDGVDNDGCIANTVVSAGGRIWMDRNLGASQVAISSTDSEAYGDLYQWGRRADGHELRTSGKTSITSSTDDPGHGNFILYLRYPNYHTGDWRSSTNNALWQGVSGINNPCPVGFRIPTEVEWDKEIASWISNDSAGAYSSPLKLVTGGGRAGAYGNAYFNGIGRMWSSTTKKGLGCYYAASLKFTDHEARMDVSNKASGYSVRCIMD